MSRPIVSPETLVEGLLLPREPGEFGALFRLALRFRRDPRRQIGEPFFRRIDAPRPVLRVAQGRPRRVEQLPRLRFGGLRLPHLAFGRPHARQRLRRSLRRRLHGPHGGRIVLAGEIGPELAQPVEPVVEQPQLLARGGERGYRFGFCGFGRPDPLGIVSS